MSCKRCLLNVRLPVDKVINDNLLHGYDTLIHHCNPFHDVVEVHLHPAWQHNRSRAEDPENKEAAAAMTTVTAKKFM